ncbi:hypothetical protein ACFFRR_007906 [Megaselia abdita]
MRPGPGLVVMALAFISGARRGSTSEQHLRQPQDNKLTSTSISLDQPTVAAAGDDDDDGRRGVGRGSGRGGGLEAGFTTPVFDYFYSVINLNYKSYYNSNFDYNLNNKVSKIGYQDDFKHVGIGSTGTSGSGSSGGGSRSGKKIASSVSGGGELSGVGGGRRRGRVTSRSGDTRFLYNREKRTVKNQQKFSENPTFDSGSSLSRVNPWISACDLAQPSSAPDLQGQCSTGALPVAWVEEGPGPPKCPKSCEQQRLEQSVNSNNNNNNIKNNNNNRNNNLNNKMNSIHTHISNNDHQPPHKRSNFREVQELTQEQNSQQQLTEEQIVDEYMNLERISWQNSEPSVNNDEAAADDETNNHNNNYREQQPQHQQQQQCLDYLGDNDEFSPTQLCKNKPSELAKRLRSLRLKHCCERNVFSLLHTLALNATLSGGDQCVQALNDILEQDALANRISCEYSEILYRYDCRQIYSIRNQCSDCTEGYRRWVCSTLFPYFAEPADIRRKSDKKHKQQQQQQQTVDQTTTNSRNNQTDNISQTNRLIDKNKTNSNLHITNNVRDDNNNINSRKGRSVKIDYNNDKLAPETSLPSSSLALPATTSSTLSATPSPSSSSSSSSSSSMSLSALSSSINVNNLKIKNNKINPNMDNDSFKVHHLQTKTAVKNPIEETFQRNNLEESNSQGDDVNVENNVIARALRRSRRKIEYLKRKRIRPCLSVCQTVEQKCPYLLPGDRAPSYPTQYAGEPTFLCLDPNIPETGEQLRKSSDGPPECCYTYCGHPEDGLCTYCDEFINEDTNNDKRNNNITNSNSHSSSPTSPTTSENTTAILSVDSNSDTPFATDGTTIYYEPEEMLTKPIAECQAVQPGPTKCMYYGSKQEAALAAGETASSAATPSPLKQFRTSSSTSSKLLYMLFMYRYLFLWTILWYLVNNFYIKLTLNCLSNGSSCCSSKGSSASTPRKKQVCCYDDGYVCSASNKMSAKQKNTSYFYRNRNYRYRYNKIIYNWKEITRRTSYNTGPQQLVKL